LEQASVYKYVLTFRSERIDGGILDKIHFDGRRIQAGGDENRILIGFEQPLGFGVADKLDRLRQGRFDADGQNADRGNHEPERASSASARRISDRELAKHQSLNSPQFRCERSHGR
jgi:hypothetical protein